MSRILFTLADVAANFGYPCGSTFIPDRSKCWTDPKTGKRLKVPLTYQVYQRIKQSNGKAAQALYKDREQRIRDSRRASVPGWKKQLPAVIDKSLEQVAPLKKKKSPKILKNKEPWEKTLEEFASDYGANSRALGKLAKAGELELGVLPGEYRGSDGKDRLGNRDANAVKQHYTAVRDALREGKSVPRKVLQQYMDLKQQIVKQEKSLRKQSSSGAPNKIAQQPTKEPKTVTPERLDRAYENLRKQGQKLNQKQSSLRAEIARAKKAGDTESVKKLAPQLAPTHLRETQMAYRLNKLRKLDPRLTSESSHSPEEKADFAKPLKRRLKRRRRDLCSCASFSVGDTYTRRSPLGKTVVVRKGKRKKDFLKPALIGAGVAGLVGAGLLLTLRKGKSININSSSLHAQSLMKGVRRGSKLAGLEKQNLRRLGKRTPAQRELRPTPPIPTASPTPEVTEVVAATLKKRGRPRKNPIASLLGGG